MCIQLLGFLGSEDLKPIFFQRPARLSIASSILESVGWKFTGQLGPPKAQSTQRPIPPKKLRFRDC